MISLRRIQMFLLTYLLLTSKGRGREGTGRGGEGKGEEGRGEGRGGKGARAVLTFPLKKPCHKYAILDNHTHYYGH